MTYHNYLKISYDKYIMDIKNKYHKQSTIKNWKRIGLIYDDYDDLYEVYIKTMNCGHCNKEFKSTHHRQMDHDHTTGLFRNVVCASCNNHDRYINHPSGVDRKQYLKEYAQNHKEQLAKNSNNYYRRNREERLNKASEKIHCECGSFLRKDALSRHKTSKKHIEYTSNK